MTTNEYPFSPTAPGRFGNNFNGAQVYAFDKAALAARAASVNVVQFQRTQLSQNGHVVPGFTLAPAQVPDSAFQTANNGTEYFLSSIAGEEAQPGNFTGQADVHRRLLGDQHRGRSTTRARRSASTVRCVRRSSYVVPPRSTQKFGPTPLANFCTVTDCFGFGPMPESEGPLDHDDSRMLQVYYANGQLYGALDTGVQVAGRLQAGIAWFLVNPGIGTRRPAP